MTDLFGGKIKKTSPLYPDLSTPHSHGEPGVQGSVFPPHFTGEECAGAGLLWEEPAFLSFSHLPAS